jgi:tetratricopeptide (TPR) repeat protein
MTTSLINPYIAGNPIRDQERFFGRQDIISGVEKVLRQQGNDGIVLYGQRRIGKTSILLQLEKRLLHGEEFTPVYFDLQDKAAKSLREVLFELSQHISRVTGHLLVQPKDLDHIEDYFLEAFLPKIVEKLPGSGLLLLFDEFDVLDSPQAFQASEAFFPYIRRLMTEIRKVKFVFVIGRRPEELSVRTMSTFKDIQTMRISFLAQKDAENIVQQSEENQSLRWDYDAIQEVIKWTHGHPYFTQLLCSVIWENAHDRKSIKTLVVTTDDVENSVDTALKSGANTFNWLWEGLPPAERVVMAAMSEINSDIITQDTLIEVLNQSGVRLVTRELEVAPRTLIGWELLTEINGGYRFTMPIFQRWVSTARPLRRVKDELDRVDPLANALFQTGQAYYNSGNFDLAEQQLHQALKTNPNHLKARLLLGEVEFEKGDLNKAVITFEEAYQYDEGAARSGLINSLLALAETQERDSQLSTYLQILKIQPEQSLALEKIRSFDVDVDKVKQKNNLNPYIYGRTLFHTEFYGRWRELNRISSRLASGQSIAIIGQPHVGKTSLLRFIANTESRRSKFGDELEKNHFVFMDLQTLQSANNPSDFWKDALAPLVDSDFRKHIEKYGYNNFALEQIFNDLNRTGRKLVLLLDEFDSLLSHPVLNSPDFYGSLRTLASRSGGLVLVIAARHSLDELNRLTQQLNPHGSPYFNVFVEIQLGALKSEDLATLLDRGSDHITRTDRLYVERVSGRHPYLAQIAAAMLWDAHEEGFADRARYIAAGHNLHQLTRPHFADTWRFWSRHVRKIVTTVALTQIANFLTHSQIKARDLVGDFEDFAVELDVLQVSGTLIQIENGEWIVAQESLLWWLTGELRRSLRDDVSFGDWLRSQETDNLFTEEDKINLSHLALTIIDLVRKDSAVLIESLASEFGNIKD